MRERPILFSAPMVRAILDGRKTKTRRIVKNRGCLPEFRGPSGCTDDVTCWGWEDGETSDHIAIGAPDPETAHGLYLPCPYGVPGDRLWVREAWAVKRHEPCLEHERDYQELCGPAVRYLADGTEIRHQGDRATGQGIYRGLVEKGRPSIHMPRWASRITLEITDVRVERLNDISIDDAIAEGLEWVSPTFGIGGIAESWSQNPIDAYARLWENINGPDSWAANPWVWAVEFKRVRP